MKRLLLLMLVIAGAGLAALLGVLWLASPVSADAGPHRGPVAGAALPDFCAICHRVHTAVEAPLFRFSKGAYPTVCEACHDGTGSNLNVRDGVAVYAAAGSNGLRAGGFINVMQDPEADGSPASGAVTSTHSRDATAQKAWGGGDGTAYYASSSGLSGTINLSCGNCHNPHGNSNYRILRGNPNEMYLESTAAAVDLPDEENVEYLYAVYAVAGDLTSTGVTITNPSNIAGAFNDTEATVTGFSGTTTDLVTFTNIANTVATGVSGKYVQVRFRAEGYVNDVFQLRICTDGTCAASTLLATFDNTTPANNPPKWLNTYSYDASAVLTTEVLINAAQVRFIGAGTGGTADDNITLYLDGAAVTRERTATNSEHLYNTANALTGGGGATVGSPANANDLIFDGDYAVLSGANVTSALGDWAFTGMVDPSITIGDGAVGGTDTPVYLEVRIYGTWTAGVGPIALQVKNAVTWASPIAVGSWTNGGTDCTNDVPVAATTCRYTLTGDNFDTAAEVTNAEFRFSWAATANTIAFNVDAVRLIVGEKTYTITYQTVSGRQYRDVAYAPKNIAKWCAQCHTRMAAGVGAGRTDAGTAYFKYRHYTDGLAGGCLNCHMPHGSRATMAPYSTAAGATWPDATAVTAGQESRLLHVNSRGVCFRCHYNISDD